MKTTNGKTARLLSRLSHFYNPKELEKTFLGLFETFGESLEVCERDIYQVLKAHHARTAENVGSKGYIAPPQDHGDIDKLYSLYLETLGGTSQLVGMNPLFTHKSFDEERLLSTLYLTTFAVTSENVQTLLQTLLRTQKFNDDLLYGLIRQISLSVDKDPQEDVLNTYLIDYLKFEAEEIDSGFVFSLITKDSPFANYLFDSLQESTQRLLFTYEGKGKISDEIKEALAKELNEGILIDPFLFQKNYNFFKTISLDENALLLRNSLNKEFLKRKFKKEFEENPESYGNSVFNLQTAIEMLDFAEKPAKPMMNDLQRLNRMLLDHASFHRNGKKTWGFRKREIVTKATVRKTLQKRLNYLITSEEKKVDSLFGLLLANVKNGDELTKLYENDQQMLRRFLLETVFPYEVKHIYRIYQDRLHSLIQVLRKGASTKEGIKDIIAANFGLISDEPDAIKARDLIQIEEYDPVETEYKNVTTPLFRSFPIRNDNEEPATPKIKLTLLPSQIESIQEIKIVDLTSKQEFTIPVVMNTNDHLVIEDGILSINGAISSKKILGDFFNLPPKKTVDWQIEAKIKKADALPASDELPANEELPSEEEQYGIYGRFDETTFDNALFTPPEEDLLRVQVLTDRLTYSSFTIIIPWHIEGITDRFAEGKDHPRNMIRSLVSKVKAAGVRAKVSYLQDFQETYELSDQLNFTLRGARLNEAQDYYDSFSIDSRSEVEEDHTMEDELRTSGIFDYTRFDSENRFE